MKQLNMDGIVERSSAMMEVLSVYTEMFYRGYSTDLTAYEYSSDSFYIDATIFCDNKSEQFEITQYLLNHPAKHHGTIIASDSEGHYWVSYKIVQ